MVRHIEEPVTEVGNREGKSHTWQLERVN